MKISEAFREYRDAEIIAANLSKKTYESYFYSERLAVQFFGDVPVENIRQEDVRDYYQHLLGWQKPDTARGNIICLRAVLRYLWRRGASVMAPEDIKVPKREKRVIEYLTPDEVERFVEVMAAPRRGYPKINRVRNVLIVKILYATGMRVGELCKLNRNSFKGGQTVVVGKSKTPRPVYINKEIEQLISEYLTLRSDSNTALFVSDRGGQRLRPDAIRKAFRDACDRSDFNNVHPHTLRHSFATRMLAEGVDLRYIADFMGHESLDTTRMYTHYSNPKLKEIYDGVWKTF